MVKRKPAQRKTTRNRNNRRKPANYLIEFRLTGYSKKYAKRLIYGVAKRFHVKGVTKKRPVPHITLFGGFTTKHERNMVSRVVNVVRKYEPVPFKINGFGNFSNRVIFLDIEPSKELKKLRKEIADQLLPITETKELDKNEDFEFHATVAFKDIERKFDDIWEYIKRKEEPNINQHLLRVTILKNGKILKEYDLILGKLLNRKQALSRYWWRKTFTAFRKKYKKFRYELGKEGLIDKIISPIIERTLVHVFTKQTCPNCAGQVTNEQIKRLKQGESVKCEHCDRLLMSFAEKEMKVESKWEKFVSSRFLKVILVAIVIMLLGVLAG